MIYEDKEYLPDHNGNYWCPWGPCGNLDYPTQKWRTDSGFAKHLAKCSNRPVAPYIPPPPEERPWLLDCPDCGKPIIKEDAVWKMPDKVVCLDCYLPYYGDGSDVVGYVDFLELELPGVALFG